jgi:HEAT repeat protein
MPSLAWLNPLWLALAWMPIAQAIPCEPPGNAQESGTSREDVIRAALTKCHAHPEIAVHVIALDLERLGDAAIPDLVATLARVPDPGTLEVIESNAASHRSREREVVLCALGRMSRAAVLRVVAHSDADVDARVGALDVLARIGSANEIELVRKLASGSEPIADALVRASRSAVAGICARGPAALGAVEEEYTRFPVPIRPAVLEGLAQTRAEGVPVVLADLVERDDANQVLALSLLSSLADAIPRPVDERILSLVHRLAADADGEAQSEAVLAAGRIGDDASIPRLIDLLSSPRRAIRANALWSLRRLTLLELREDPAHWRAWYREESAWWLHESRRVLRDLASRDPELLKPALVQVAKRSMRREELASLTLRALDHEDPGVVALACNALGYLRVPATVPCLVPYLSDRDPGVRNAAWSALKRITGKSLPADPGAWRAFAEGTSSRRG